jgi:BirA family transcriptional regulator, biotin operon repressor / biotin---[acetyl-CoA-carboxylase] ligase
MIIGSKLFFFRNLTSTNIKAASLLKDSNPGEGAIIYTNFQSSGKGQGNNKWESEDGKNLLMSIIIYPSDIKVSDQFLISMIVSLGICDFLKRYLSLYSIKWPNDIYVNNDKIAGILIENAILGEKIKHSVIGIGLNINQKKFTGNAPNPVSLSILNKTEYELLTCLKELAYNIDKRYKLLLHGHIDNILAEYNNNLYRINQWCFFEDSTGKFKGRIISIGSDGILRIEKENGTFKNFYFKEIEFIL